MPSIRFAELATDGTFLQAREIKHSQRIDPARKTQLAALHDTRGNLESELDGLRKQEGFVRFLAKESEGVPFFGAEYLRLAVAEGLLRRENGRWTFDVDGDREESYRTLSLPASLKELVERRLKGLKPLRDKPCSACPSRGVRGVAKPFVGRCIPAQLALNQARGGRA